MKIVYNSTDRVPKYESTEAGPSLSIILLLLVLKTLLLSEIYNRWVIRKFTTIVNIRYFYWQYFLRRMQKQTRKP